MKKLTAKIYFDMIMVLLWLILIVFDDNIWHEILGITVLLMTIIHLGYNISKISKEISAIISQKNGSVTFRYIINILLMLFALLTIGSGISISEYLFPGIAGYRREFWKDIHETSAYIALFCICIHIKLHAKMILAVLKKN